MEHYVDSSLSRYTYCKIQPLDVLRYAVITTVLEYSFDLVAEEFYNLCS